MRVPTERVLFWAPRALVILFALFVSAFALDVFDMKLGFWQSIFALGVHLVPTIALLLVLAVAWHWELLGGALCIGLGVLYIVTAWGRFGWMAYAFIGVPPIVVGLLFFAHWWTTHHKGHQGKGPPLTPA